MSGAVFLFPQFSVLVLNKPLVRGSCAARGRFFSRTPTFSFNKPLVRGSCVARGRTFSQKSDFVEEATCPAYLRCMGQNFFLRNRSFWKKPLVQGSCAAWGRTVSQKSVFSGRSHLSRAAALPGAELFYQKSVFLEDATCPGALGA